MRFEVRVCRGESAWEVRAGDGVPNLFSSEWAALNHARNIARLAWIDDAVLSAVRIFTSNGHWETDTLFGGESGEYYRGG